MSRRRISVHEVKYRRRISTIGSDGCARELARHRVHAAQISGGQRGLPALALDDGAEAIEPHRVAENMILVRTEVSAERLRFHADEAMNARERSGCVVT